ncbi:hypothetical protein AB833_20710 [Chromatiales bacterium (ex Bugula neritina AB1)]|nr:hypothetical protein AB833_20710 [Chromatiales bacterium (ex Bugula neritina AB1)]
MTDLLESTIPMADITALTVAYLVVVVLLLALNLFTPWNWVVKLGMNIFVMVFFLITYHSWPKILGWPTERDLPEKFYLHAINVDEPHRIYLWAADISTGLGRTTPRSFALPYSAKLHDSVDKANRKLKKGLPMIGLVNSAPGSTSDLSRFEQTQVHNLSITFIDAPQALIPGKN